MNQLTNQQRLQIFMLYPNALIKAISEEDGLTFEGSRVRKWILNNMEEPDLMLFSGDGRPSEYFSLSECQLLLKGIDQLTGYERDPLVRILGFSPEDGDHIDIFGRTKESTALHVRTQAGNSYECYNLRSDLGKLPYPAADYLRKKNYALPFEGIDLFESGIAVRTNQK